MTKNPTQRNSRQFVIFPHYKNETIKEIRDYVTDETLAVIHNDEAIRVFVGGLTILAKTTKQQITVYNLAVKAVVTIIPDERKYNSYGVMTSKLYPEQEERINKRLKQGIKGKQE